MYLQSNDTRRVASGLVPGVEDAIKTRRPDSNRVNAVVHKRKRTRVAKWMGPCIVLNLDKLL